MVKFAHSRVFRILVCTFLICCMIVQVSPIRVKALSATAVAISVPIAVAVAASLPALGIRPGTDPSVFSQFCSSLGESLSLGGSWVVDGMVTMLALEADGVTKTYAQTNFLQALLDYIFANDVVTSSCSPYSSGTPFTFYGGVTYTPLGDYVVLNASFIDSYGYNALYQMVYFLSGSSYTASDGTNHPASSKVIDGVTHYYIGFGGASSSAALALATPFFCGDKQILSCIWMSTYLFTQLDENCCLIHSDE